MQARPLSDAEVRALDTRNPRVYKQDEIRHLLSSVSPASWHLVEVPATRASGLQRYLQSVGRHVGLTVSTRQTDDGVAFAVYPFASEPVNPLAHRVFADLDRLAAGGQVATPEDVAERLGIAGRKGLRVVAGHVERWINARTGGRDLAYLFDPSEEAA